MSANYWLIYYAQALRKKRRGGVEWIDAHLLCNFIDFIQSCIDRLID
jgi:hypothetical protein